LDALTLSAAGRQTLSCGPAECYSRAKGDSLKFAGTVASLGLAVTAWGQYAGPAILTRGEAPVAMSAPMIHFRPFLELTGIYDSGLAAVSTNDQGGLANESSAGIEATWGISGVHSWRHTKIGLDYRGDLTHYTRTSAFDAVDQSLLLGITHQLTRHVTLMLRTSAGIFTRDFGLISLPQTVPFDPNTLSIPTTDFFDNRTMYVSSQLDMIYQKSSRLSFDLGGGGAIVRRRSLALEGTESANAHGDVQYRLSRRTTIGANYSYEHFAFTHIFGGTDVQSMAGTFAMQLSRYWEFTGYAGVARAESKFIQSVPIDPTIAALLGIAQGTEVIHTINWIPNLSGRLSRVFQRGIAYVAGGHTVVPGNGLFLTSYMTSGNLGYTYTGLRHWSFNAEAAYAKSRSIGNIIGTYGTISGNLSASRQIIPSVHFVTQYSARRYDSPNFANYNRLIHEARIGFGWSPGDIPLRIW
jgi:hypothetical protein